MNRLTNQSGGMPLQLSDFRYIHEIYQGAFKAIIDGLNGVQACIITGIEVATGVTVTVTSGYYWDGTELFYVGSYSGTPQSGYKPYIIRQDTSDNPRVFHNGSTYNCHESRQYAVGYAATVPTGGIEISTIQRLADIIDEQTRDVISAANQFSISTSVNYESGYTKIGDYNAVHVSGNNLGDVMLIAAFTTSNANGKICTLPLAYRPPADIVGSFLASTILGSLLVKANGEVWVIGANTSGNNYVTFQFNSRFTNNVNYSVNTGGLPY